MTATILPTPADLSITPRDRRFGRDAATPRLWHGGRVEATAIYNALSATFPIGEAYFVESVRAFREGAPPKLAVGHEEHQVAESTLSLVLNALGDSLLGPPIALALGLPRDAARELAAQRLRHRLEAEHPKG